MHSLVSALSDPTVSDRDAVLALAARAATSPLRDAAHLADYAFHFDTAEAVRLAPSRPHPHAEWTLRETLDELAYRDAELTLASSGVKLRHAHRMPHVAQNVARHADALAAGLRLGDAVDTVAPGWDAATRLYAAWFMRDFAPAGPLSLAPGVTVTDLPRYRRAVADRLALGPAAAGADALGATLADLFERFGNKAAPAERREIAWPMAA